MFSEKLKESCGKIRKNSDLYKLLLEETAFLDSMNPTKYQREYHVINDIDGILLCKNCGINPVKWNGKYKTYCSVKCSNSSIDKNVKYQNTLQEKYGVSNISHSKEHQARKRLTNLEKYGAEAPSLVPEILEKRNKTRIKTFSKKFFDKVKNNDKYDYSLVEYKTAHTKVKIICKKHGVFEQSPNNHLNGKGCPKCAHIISLGERQIVEYVKSFGIDVITNSRSIIKPFELDLYVKDLRIAVEHNGLYWHTVDRKYELYHLEKLNLCQNRDIKLIQFWDFEWIEKNEICKSIIKSNLKLNDVIYARKTKVKLVNDVDKISFLNENHIQGNCVSSVNLGLYYENQLVAIMTFNEPTFDEKYDWEMIRFCNKLGINVVGGANKLFKFFQKNYSGTIISYSDKRLFDGKIYEKLEFVKLTVEPPNYFYHKDAEIIPRCDETLLENQNMIDVGWEKVYDCGNDVWVKI